MTLAWRRLHRRHRAAPPVEGARRLAAGARNLGHRRRHHDQVSSRSPARPAPTRPPTSAQVQEQVTQRQPRSRQGDKDVYNGVQEKIEKLQKESSTPRRTGWPRNKRRTNVLSATRSA
ncbi:hypothetical protein ACU686_17610 [Yinghuangia aomiensis]